MTNNWTSHSHSPIHFFLHVRGVTAAIIGQEQSSVTQPMHIYLHTGAVHDHHIGVRGLSSHLGNENHQGQVSIPSRWSPRKKLSISKIQVKKTWQKERKFMALVPLALVSMGRAQPRFKQTG